MGTTLGYWRIRLPRGYVRRSLIDPPLRPPLAEPRISTAVRNDGVGLDKPNANSAHPKQYNQSRIKRRQPVRTLSSKLWFFVSVLLVAFALLAALSRKYFWLYATRRGDPPPPAADLLRDASTSNNPEVLLEEANRLAWLFNWPKAEPLYIRAEDLFRAKGDTRNEIYARVGRIRAQSETVSWAEVSNVLGQQLDLPIVKTDPKLRLWSLAAKGYTDLEISPASAKRAWTEAQTIAHRLGEAQWEARAEGDAAIGPPPVRPPGGAVPALVRAAASAPRARAMVGFHGSPVRRARVRS